MAVLNRIVVTNCPVCMKTHEYLLSANKDSEIAVSHFRASPGRLREEADEHGAIPWQIVLTCPEKKERFAVWVKGLDGQGIPVAYKTDTENVMVAPSKEHTHE